MYINHGVTNNPFNIRSSKRNSWLGQTGTRKGFCKFSNCRFGVRAGIVLLRNYIRRGVNTIDAIVNRYAPATENDTERYIRYVSSYAQIGRYVPVAFNSEEFFRVVIAILFYESHYVITTTEIKDIIIEFKL